MRKIVFVLFILLCSCYSITPPDSFVYKEIQTDIYKLATWQKITDKNKPIRIYIEGDGYAFNSHGYPTNNPTPKNTFLRKIAFDDPNENVVYLARPCQYVKDNHCSQKDWTTGRFSQDIVNSTTHAIKEISNHHSITLIGYSGGAMLSGLIIEQNSQLNIEKWITIAGLLNHEKWTELLKLQPLKNSLNLKKIPNIKQTHLVGEKDRVVPYKITKEIVKEKDLIIVPNATHNSGYEDYYSIIYDKN